MAQPADILLTQRFPPEHGGSIRWMHEVYRGWPRPVHVITHDYYDAPPRTPEFPGVPQRPQTGDDVTAANLTMDRRDIFLHDWGVASLANLRRYLRMTTAVKQQLAIHRRIRVHCTHVLPEVLSLLPLRWRYGRRLQIVCYAHGEEITACGSSRQLSFLMRRGYAIVDLLLANSQYTAGLAADHVAAEKIHVVHPGVEVAEFADADAAGARWRQEQGYDDKIVVVTVGRLDPRKNQAAVVDAVADLAGQFANLLYVVAGEGRQMSALRQQVAERGVEKHVVFTGPIDGQLRLALFGACDVFAMPAIQDGTDVEGFGIVFLEAGACGKATLGGTVGGQADAVDDGQTGLLVDGDNQPAVTAALEKLLRDGDLRCRLGGQGRAKAREHDWARVIQRTVELVEELG